MNYKIKYIQLINEQSFKVSKVIEETNERIIVECKEPSDAIFIYEIYKQSIAFMELEETDDDTT